VNFETFSAIEPTGRVLSA